MNTKSPQPLKWNDENISNLWNYYAEKNDDTYFSKQVGKQIVHLTKLTNKKINVLDFGCGKGFLGGYIFNKNIPWKYYGVDFSATSVDEAKKRLSSLNVDTSKFEISHIKEMPISIYKEESFDLIFLLEVIEHLNDEKLEKTLIECHRLLKKGGILFITTPNNEKLEDSHVYCPCCNQYFHKWQHERIWTIESLSTYLTNNNYSVRNTFQVNLGKNRFQTTIKTIVKKFLVKNKTI